MDEIGREVFALQGTRAYLVRTATLMSENTRDAQVAAAGDRILARLSTQKVDYYITSARWAGRRGSGVRRGLVWGVSRVVQVFKVAL